MDTAPVRLDRMTLTKTQLRATEIVLYRMADLVNRLKADQGVQYTKVTLQPPPAPALQPPGWTYGGETNVGGQ